MYKNVLVKGIYALGICFLQLNTTYAQSDPYQPDTLKVEIKQAEKIFLDKNLSLLAQHYNIQSQQALIEQAKKWENPILNTDQNVYANNRFFRHGIDANGNPEGQFYVQVQQLIKTANKRGRQIDLAKTNTTLAEWQFKSTLRNLRATLLKDFYTIAQLEGNAALYNDNMQRLTHLLNAQEAQLQAGNIAKKEYLRVEALIVSLQQDMTDNAKNINDAESELKTLLQVTGNTFIQPVLDDNDNTDVPAITLEQLIDTAKQYNTDYQQELYQLQYQRQNLSLQRALSVPDIIFGPEFDQNSNYAPNYVGLGISLPLPTWDRNQGNIKSARFQIKQEEAMMQQIDQKLQNDVRNAYQKLLYTIRLSSSTNQQFFKDYYQLQKNIIESYDARQISLLEFLEYFGDYQDIREKQLQQTLNLRLAKEEVNDLAGTDVIQ